jgi:hypothetical protein
VVCRCNNLFERVLLQETLYIGRFLYVCVDDAPVSPDHLCIYRIIVPIFVERAQRDFEQSRAGIAAPQLWDRAIHDVNDTRKASVYLWATVETDPISTRNCGEYVVYLANGKYSYASLAICTYPGGAGLWTPDHEATLPCVLNVCLLVRGIIFVEHEIVFTRDEGLDCRPYLETVSNFLLESQGKYMRRGGTVYLHQPFAGTAVLTA